MYARTHTHAPAPLVSIISHVLMCRLYSCILLTELGQVMFVCLLLLLLLSLQDVSVCERDSQAVIAYLSRASEYAALIKANYPRLLSLLSQGAVSAGGGGGRGEGERGEREGGGGGGGGEGKGGEGEGKEREEEGREREERGRGRREREERERGRGRWRERVVASGGAVVEVSDTSSVKLLFAS